MWPYLVQEIGGVWNGLTIQHGRDLAMIEERPKPRDVLIESLAEVPAGRLSETQRASLAADLIDLYPRLRAEQRPAIDRELAALGGNDLVEILRRRGLAEDNYLKAAIDERRARRPRAALGVRSARARWCRPSATIRWRVVFSRDEHAAALCPRSHAAPQSEMHEEPRGQGAICSTSARSPIRSAAISSNRSAPPS